MGFNFNCSYDKRRPVCNISTSLVELPPNMATPLSQFLVQVILVALQMVSLLTGGTVLVTGREGANYEIFKFLTLLILFNAMFVANVCLTTSSALSLTLFFPFPKRLVPVPCVLPARAPFVQYEA